MATSDQVTRLGSAVALSIGLVAMPFVPAFAGNASSSAAHPTTVRTAGGVAAGRVPTGTQLAQDSGTGATGANDSGSGTAGTNGAAGNGTYGGTYGANGATGRRGRGAWGWIGLIGLFGLLGLRPTRSRTTVGTTTTPPLR